VTRLLQAWRDGDELAADSLMRLVYDELHVIADARMRREAPDHTLRSTALVHEAYLRLAGAGVSWTDRKHFFAAAARAMRRVLTDHARARQREKRGGGLDRVTLANLPAPEAGDTLDLVALDEAVEALAVQDPRKASAVELHYYAGLSYDEVAEALDISPATVHRDLRMARAWLHSRLL
jgi:RNA polymerase sigma factor (TIGR02999 family)